MLCLVSSNTVDPHGFAAVDSAGLQLECLTRAAAGMELEEDNRFDHRLDPLQVGLDDAGAHGANFLRFAHSRETLARTTYGAQGVVDVGPDELLFGRPPKHSTYPIDL